MSDHGPRLEAALEAAVDRLTQPDTPPRLVKAVRHATFPAGGRLRPTLCYAVAGALGEVDPELTDAAAVALEFLHCASLIQDDLPAFDDGLTRRDRPTVHRVYGEALAVLASDALIIGAFEEVGRLTTRHPAAAGALIVTLARGTGTPHGAVAGQAWECELAVSLKQYHRAKTAALFEAATAAGALAANGNAAEWRGPGHWLGRAYQLADDLGDVGSESERGSDAALGRPNAVRSLGTRRTEWLFDAFARRAVDTIPECPGRDDLRARFQHAARRLRPLVLLGKPPRATALPPQAAVAAMGRS